MNILSNPYFLSNLILIFTTIYIFFRYFRNLPLYNRILWGIFLLCISLNSLVHLATYAELEFFTSLQRITQSAEMTLGATCLVSASWSLIRRSATDSMQLSSTISIGLLLFYCITWFRVEYFGMIVQSLCIVITMVISCLGLSGRQKSALWIIFSMMFLALSSKSARLNLPLPPVDVYHYMIALAVICAGKAVKNEYELLF